ncbi:hypothetical protein EDF81_3730 [Enterobacter sp. BIGb0383]|uniref:hypothetical protein n=1 Tax=unclassified Enterobacter TaxID=2608935 RepID=UPI000F48C531|nr:MULTISPECIES: hypothetical protein [unclassified Enterobacter]ROP56180.1 hypothetical protein EDF81_3730 [Enterobacter sp. BIGb0383]ROS05918.1 hypothetical protein EC848_3869 [Enterobacter sp. BIGb0359]
MGYKYKATMYYSDEGMERFLAEKSIKPNGKKSASQYLYALVSRERESTGNADIAKGESGVIKLYPQFIGGKQIDINGRVAFSSLATASLGRQKKAEQRLKTKMLMEEIDKAIVEQVMSEGFLQPKVLDKALDNNDFSIILKTEVTCHYHEEAYLDDYCQGIFTARCLILHITQLEWERLDGKYDFENIKYFKYEDLAKVEKHTQRGLCKIAELSPKDNAGAFFIPVRATSRAFPSGSVPMNSLSIRGVDISFNKNRVKLKAMNATQRKRYFGLGMG